jgi:hypothetical protein
MTAPVDPAMKKLDRGAASARLKLSGEYQLSSKPALDFIRNDAGISDPPCRAGDGFYLGEIRHLDSSDDHALVVESHGR